MRKESHARGMVFCSALLVWLLTSGCGARYRTERFAYRVKSTVNPDELQAWATNLLDSTNSKTGIIPAKDLPPFLHKIYNDDPEFGCVNGSGGSNEFVSITFGGGFGHWGLFVGRPSFKRESLGDVFLMKWRPGVYFMDSP